jgi:DNA-binding MarR family transcriptional regulator
MEQHNIAVMIRIASIHFERYGQKYLAEYGLSFSQFAILKYLMLREGTPIRQVDIEKFFLLSNPTVTGILNNLEKKDLIERRPNPDDGRSKLIVLTEKARAFDPQLDAIREKLDENFTHMLTEEEKEQMRILLRKIING